MSFFVIPKPPRTRSGAECPHSIPWLRENPANFCLV